MRSSVRIVLAFFLAVLILSNYNSIRILNHAVQFLEADLKERSHLALQQFTRDLEEIGQLAAVVPTSILTSEMGSLGIRGVVLYREGGQKSRAVIPGLPPEFADPMSLLGQEADKIYNNWLLLKGTTVLNGIRRPVVLIFDARRLVQMERTTRIVSYTNVLLMIFAGVLVIYFFESAFRPYRMLMQTAKSAAEHTPEKNEADFLINTFNGVITRLRQKEQELERLHQNEKARADDVEQLNQDLVRSISSGLILLDSDGRIRYFNEAASSILSRPREEALHQPYQLLLSSLAPALIEDLNRCFRDHASVSRAEIEIRRPDGQTRFLGAAIMPMQDRQQNFAGVLCLFSDITEFKKLQQHIAQKEKFATLGEMAGGVAHEFRNSVATISGYVQMLEGRVVDSQKSHIGAIQTELASLQKVISQFLSFARPVEPEMDAVDLSVLLQECIEEVRIAAPADTEFTMSGEIPSIKGDEAMLRQVFLNLIRNASESVEGIGRNGDIHIRCSPGEDSKSVVVEVQDNGAGIHPEDISRIFTPFFTRKRQGVGLGLAIAQKLVLQHNGSISVESKGQGTTFRVSLPSL